MQRKQRTIQNSKSCKGIGLHTGKKVNMTLLPAPPNHGIIFKRIDLKTKNLIEANFLKQDIFQKNTKNLVK